MKVLHILADGRLQTHADLMREQTPRQASLF